MVATSFEKGAPLEETKHARFKHFPIEGRKHFGNLQQFKASATNKLG
jgi:hypothetical protein